MKKLIVCVAGLLTISSAFAWEDPCSNKQKNAASFELAQSLGIPVQHVEVANFEPGFWTEGTENNTGSSHVTVRALDPSSDATLTQRYHVRVKQIGATNNCDIQSVHLLEN